MSNFVTNVLKIISGSVIAQALSILLIPVITRIYSPNDFGIFQLILSISGILAIVSTFSYQLSIMLPKEDEDSINIVILCIILVTLTSLFTGIVVLFLPENIDEILNAPGASRYLIYLPIIVFLNGLFFVQNYWLSRKIRFGVIAGARVSNTLLGKVFQIGLAKWIVSPVSLLLGVIAGYIFADILMLKGIKNDIKVLRKVSLLRIKELAIQYKNFPLFSSWSMIANTISPQVPTFMLALFYGTTVVGHYSLAYQVVNMPMTIVGNAIGQVFFQKVSEVKNGNLEEDMKTVVEEVYKKLISIGIFPMILLMIIGEQVFTFAFGESWSVSGTYMKILLPWIFLVFLSLPISTLYNIYDKQSVWLTFSIILLISRIAALYIGGTYGGPEFALGFFSLTGVIFWLWNNEYLLNLVGIDKKESFGILIKYMLISLVIAAPLIMLQALTSNFYIMLIVVAIITPIYYGVTFHEDPMFRKVVLSFLVSAKKRI
ncbi:oligosaccharide flippase family protein [Methanosarcina hadiensis]|uniref:oligosaccharide flippase family protein n=1 Tax=Methanosarcina hadiensis TaxID=3078083 RepID=UPI003977B784